MNPRHCSMRGAVSLVAGVATSVAIFMSPGLGGPGTAAPVTSVLYTASDFPALARGVDHGLSHEAPRFPGEAAVSVWAPWSDGWKLTAGDDGTITLKLRRAGRATTTPVAGNRWARSSSPRIGHSRSSWPTPRRRRKSGVDRRRKAKKRPPRPVPALLRLAARTDPGTVPEVNLDIVRGAGRLDRRHRPTADACEVRTNYQGADFQAPRSAEAWRDRAAAPPRADARDPRPLADVPPDAAESPGLRQAEARRLHDREGRARDVPRLHAQRQPLSAGRGDGQGPGHPLPARPLGGRPGQSRGPAALHPLGQAGLRRLPV